jgi:anaerobic ribonucleoside-triphosphate reductase activating protein
MIRIHMMACTRALGPGLRFGLWVQGCPFDCRGCVAKEAQDPTKGELWSVEALTQEVLRHPQIEGLTISGGEPFEQAREIASLVRELKKHRDFGIIVYTGYRLEELDKKAAANPAVADLVGLSDLMIDGRYIAELDDGLSLRGSSNQKVIDLSGRYSDVIDTMYGIPGRKMEITRTEHVYRMIGIPNADHRTIIRILTDGNHKEE